jgi:hypothetical protein
MILSDFPHRVGNFVGVSKDIKRKFPNGRSFRIIIYCAYDAYGLIGPESNGIAILDEDEMHVVTDEIDKAGTGYYGPTEKQLKFFEQLCTMPWQEFKEVVNTSNRARIHLE